LFSFVNNFAYVLTVNQQQTMKVTDIPWQVRDQFTGALNTQYLGTLIEVVLIASIFTIGFGTLFGAGLVDNFPKQKTNSDAWSSIWFGLGFWVVAYVVMLACHYKVLFKRIMPKSLWMCRLMHVGYWAVRWIVFIVMISFNNPTVLVLAFWMDLIVFPAAAVLCLFGILGLVCMDMVKKDYQGLV